MPTENPETTRWTCPSCRKVYRLSIGKQPPAKCPACKAPSAGPVLESQPAAAPAFAELRDLVAEEPVKLLAPTPSVFVTAKPIPRAPFFGDAMNRIPSAKIGLVLGLASLLFAGGPPSTMVLIPYAGIMAFTICARILLIARWPLARSKAATLMASLVGIALILTLGKLDRYDENGETEHFETRTTYSRWGRVPLWRAMFHKDKKRLFMMEGPLSPSGRLHGEWTNLGYGVAAGERHEWFWYGEQISEGEWQIRNK